MRVNLAWLGMLVLALTLLGQAGGFTHAQSKADANTRAADAGPQEPTSLLHAVGNGTDLWLLMPRKIRSDWGLDVAYQRALDPSDTLYPAGVMLGRLAPGGLAAAEGRLYLAFEDSSIQSMYVEMDTVTGVPVFSSPRLESPLPAGVQLRQFVAQGGSLFAWVSVPDASAEESLVKAGLGAGRGDRLLELRSKGWESVALPLSFPVASTVWLAPAQTLGRPAIVVALQGERDSNASTLWTYENLGPQHPQADAQGWVRYVHTDVLAGPASEARVLAVAGQISVLEPLQSADDRFSVQWTILRAGRAIPVGVLTYSEAKPLAWAAAPQKQSLSLLVRTRENRVESLGMDLQGNMISPPATLRSAAEQPLQHAAPYMLLMITLVLASLIMFVFWRRDPAWSKLDLPAPIALAELTTRGAAAVIDLAPAVLVAMLIFGLDLQQMFEHWPGHGRGGTWQSMYPGLTAMALHSLMSLAFELLGSRTPGKRCMGIWVSDLKGQKPAAWQVIVRNLTKPLDLIAWPLMIVAILSPHHQRLGDLVARTVVVAPKPDDEPAHDSDNSDF